MGGRRRAPAGETCGDVKGKPGDSRREIAGAEVFAQLRAPPPRSAAVISPGRGTPVWGWGVLHEGVGLWWQ